MSVFYLEHEEKRLRVGEGAKGELRLPRFGDRDVTTHNAPIETTSEPDLSTDPKTDTRYRQNAYEPQQRRTSIQRPLATPNSRGRPLRSPTQQAEDLDLDDDGTVETSHGSERGTIPGTHQDREQKVTASMHHLNLEKALVQQPGVPSSQWEDDMQTKWALKGIVSCHPIPNL